MKFIDRNGLPVTMQGERNGSVVEEVRLVDSLLDEHGNPVRSAAAKEGAEFVGTRLMLSGQAETLPGDIYSSLDDFDPRWRPFVLDFTKTLVSREKVYGPIYDSMSSAAFDEVMPIRDFTNNQSMGFSLWKDGEAVFTYNFRDAALKDTVSLDFFAGAIEKTLRNKLFNKPYLIQQEGRAKAQGYIDFLNHLHMHPIIAADYSSKLVGVASLKKRSSNTWWENNWQIMKLAKNMYFTAKDPNNQYLQLPILVMNKKTYMTSFTDTLDEISFADSKRYTSMRNWWGGIVVYDGATVKMGDKAVTYGGCADNRVIMVSPKDGFKELIKQPLTLVTKPGSELALDREIYWDCRGFIAQPNSYCYAFDLVAVDDTTDGLKST